MMVKRFIGRAVIRSVILSGILAIYIPAFIWGWGTSYGIHLAVKNYFYDWYCKALEESMDEY